MKQSWIARAGAPRRGGAAAALALAAWVVPAGAQEPLAVPPDDVPVAFVDVHVIPMDAERVLESQTVVVSGGRVAAMGPVGSTPVPAGATIVDGRGHYLLPGFADMHGHLQAGAGTLDDPAGQQLALNLAYGVTTFRSLAGAPTGVVLRERVRAGELLGPELVIYSSSLNGNSVSSPARGAALVEAHRAAGVDGIKIHGGFGAEVHDSIVAAARRAGLPVAGHVTSGYGLERAIRAGQQIEHLDGFFQAMLPAGHAGQPLDQLVADPAILARLDTTRIPEIAREMAERGVWNGPTLALFETIASETPAAELLAWPELRFVPPGARSQWATQRSQIQADVGPAAGRAEFVRLRRRIVRALHEAGAPLLVGSDSPQLFMTAGAAVHREMAAFVDAGVPPFGALVAATRAPAEYLGREDAGTVAVGNVASLVLLGGNPLEEIERTRDVVGVMVRGRWLDAARLEAIRAAVAAKHAG